MARSGSLLAPTASSSWCPQPSAAKAAGKKATVTGVIAGRGRKGRGKKARDGGEDGDGGRGKDDPEEKKEKEKAGRGRGGGGGGGGEDDVVKKVEADSFNVGA